MNRFFVVSLLLFIGCAAAPLKPGSEKVRLMQSEPKGCKYLGEVTGNQGNYFSGQWTSNDKMEKGARNEFKNKPIEMGGKVMVLLTNRAGNTGSFGTTGGSMQQTNVTMTGTVYSCPDPVPGQL